VTGCGESDQEQAREVAQDYVDARSDGDFERVCELYSDGFKEELAVAENCAGFVEEQTSGGEDQELELVSVHVNDDKASADIDVIRGSEGPSRIRVQLTRDGDDWRISGLQ
jgi:hypothetical protein